VVTFAIVAGRLTMMMSGGVVMERCLRMMVRCLPAYSPRHGGFARIPFVSMPALVRGATAFTSDFALTVRIHAGKTASIPLSHD
jgi:hypothetical protein